MSEHWPESEEKLVRIEVEVDEKTASDIEALETLYFQSKRVWTDRKKVEELATKAAGIGAKNPRALFVHIMRNPDKFATATA